MSTSAIRRASRAVAFITTTGVMLLGAAGAANAARPGPTTTALPGHRIQQAAGLGSQAPAAGPEAVAPLAVVNLGLSNRQAKNVQCWLRTFWGYTDAIDGLLGTNSWKAFQRNLKMFWGYTGEIDGIVGGGTVRALQRLLKAGWGYTGDIDGDAGPQTQAAFKRFANWAGQFC